MTDSRAFDLITSAGELATEREVDVYAVGGYVRDKLLGLSFRGEIDFSGEGV